MKLTISQRAVLETMAEHSYTIRHVYSYGKTYTYFYDAPVTTPVNATVFYALRDKGMVALSDENLDLWAITKKGKAAVEKKEKSDE